MIDLATRYEEALVPAFVERVKTSAVVVDCGAEYGYYVQLALEHGPKTMRIFAFEPDRTRAAVLVKIADPRLIVYPFAVGSRSEEVKLGRPYDGYSLSVMHADGVDVKTVPSIRLDDALFGFSVDILKMDVEGAEDDALEGAKFILERRPALFIEMHAPRSVVRRQATLNNLMALGYGPFQYDQFMFGGGRFASEAQR